MVVTTHLISRINHSVDWSLVESQVLSRLSTTLRKYMHSIEFVYAVVVTFALTQGPIFRLWASSAAYADILPSPSVEQVRFATYLVLQAPALLMFARRADSSWVLRLENKMLVVFLLWIGLTVLWSSYARQSLVEFMALVMTTSFGLYLASSFTLRRVVWILTSATGVGVLLSYFAVMRLWDGAVNLQESYWVGIYFNRNSLAPVAAVAAVTSCFLVQDACSHRSRMVALRLGGPLLLLLISVLVLWQSGSRTSIFALLAGVVAAVLWLTLRAAAPRLVGVTRTIRWSAPVAVFAVVTAVLLSIRLAVSTRGVPTEFAFFSSRAQVWSVNWSGFLEKPVLGWGWMAAWMIPDFPLVGDWWVLWDTKLSHNSYHDLLLGGGVPAAVLFALVVLTGATTIDDEQDKPVALLRSVLVVYVLVAATQESFFIGSHFLWSTLIAMLYAPTNQLKIQASRAIPANG